MPWLGLIEINAKPAKTLVKAANEGTVTCTRVPATASVAQVQFLIADLVILHY